jgi:hypothetical protein
MSINGIGNSAASWAQFVKISQAARERNGGGFTVDSAGGASKPAAAQTENVVSFKKAFDVYSSTLAAPVQTVQAAPSMNDVNIRTVGGRFDAYA